MKTLTRLFNIWWLHCLTLAYMTATLGVRVRRRLPTPPVAPAPIAPPRDDAYHRVQPFKLPFDALTVPPQMSESDRRRLKDDDGATLFYDIFARNNELIAILANNIYLPLRDLPPAESRLFDYDRLKITRAGTPLNLKRRIAPPTSSETQSARIQIYEFDFPLGAHQVECDFNGLKRRFKIAHRRLEKTAFLAHSTLFKKDYNLAKRFYDYHRAQGVESFIWYRNGVLEADARARAQADFGADALFVDWPFAYWRFHFDQPELNRNQEHHAQPAQLAHAFYKYAKPLFEYVMFTDFDEYISATKPTLRQTLLDAPECDLYILRNRWCKTLVAQRARRRSTPPLEFISKCRARTRPASAASSCSKPRLKRTSTSIATASRRAELTRPTKFCISPTSILPPIACSPS